MPVPVTAELVKHVAALASRPIPVATRIKVKQHLLDALGCAMAGASTPVSRRIHEVLIELGGHGAARAAAFGSAPSVPLLYGGLAASLEAVFLNAVAIHGLEADDGCREGSVHPAAVIVPAVLAAAYQRACDGMTLLASLVAGYEVTVSIAEAIHPWSTRHGFQNTPVAGVLGAAAGAATVFGLSPAQIESAIGIASSSAGGTFAYLAGGGDVKKIHVGNAARGGFLAAALAGRNAIQGPRGVLEARHGFLQCYGGYTEGNRPDGEGCRDPGLALAAGHAIERCYLKPYPSCRFLHPAIDALLSLRREAGLRPDDIAEVVVDSYAAATDLRDVGWTSLFSAQLSFPYSLAVAIECGEVSNAGFSEAARGNPAILRHVPSIVIREDADMTAAFPGEAAARVQILTRAGQVLQASVTQPLGSVERPLSEAQVIDKFLRQAGDCLPAATLDSIVAQVLDLEHCGDIRILLNTISQARSL